MNSDVDDAFEGFELDIVFDSNPLGKIEEKYGLRRKLELEPTEVTEWKKMGKKKKENGGRLTDADGESEADVDMAESSHNTGTGSSQTQTQANAATGTTSQTQQQRNGRHKNNTKLDSNWEKNTTNTTFFIERIKPDDKPIHPMEMAKILHKVEIKDYKELKSAGQGRFRITFHRPRDAEKLINSKLIKDEFKFKIYVPNMLKQTIGVVRNVPPSLTDEEIQETIQAGRKTITKVERIHKMVNKVLTPTYSIKIYVDGQELPDEVSIYGQTAKVDYYIFPVKLCSKCWRYGHKVKACKSSKSRCVRCGLEHDNNPCWAPARCTHCGGPHLANDKNCNERVRQEKILQVMATERLTFIETMRRFPRHNGI